MPTTLIRNEATTPKSRSLANNRTLSHLDTYLAKGRVAGTKILCLLRLPLVRHSTPPLHHLVRHGQSIQVHVPESEGAAADDTPGPLRGEPLEVACVYREKRILIRRQTCGKRPKFVEKNGTVHPYCGRTCAKAQQPTCKLPGCRESGKSAFGGFCSPRHSR